MALLHQATVTPTKLELLGAWLPGRPWSGATGDLAGVWVQLGTFRFDDPAGEVGVETLLLRSGDGAVLQVPLTYRAAPLPGAERHLVGTARHSVLGPRWVYDGCGDPVWVTTLLTAVLTGGTEAELMIDTPGGPVPRDRATTVRGSGTPGTAVPAVGAVSCHDEGPVTVVRSGDAVIHVARVVGSEVPGGATLTGRWDGGAPVVLAGVRAG